MRRKMSVGAVYLKEGAGGGGPFEGPGGKLEELYPYIDPHGNPLRIYPYSDPSG